MVTVFIALRVLATRLITTHELPSRVWLDLRVPRDFPGPGRSLGADIQRAQCPSIHQHGCGLGLPE